MNNNHNKRLLVIMVTSALMTCPVWASGTQGYPADTTAAQDSTLSEILDGSQGFNKSSTASSTAVQPAAVTNLASGTTQTAAAAASPTVTTAADTTATSLPATVKYPIALLTPQEEANLPYANAVTPESVQPYVGKVATGIHIAPVPDTQIETTLLPRLALREGDAINIDYIRHDLNVIGGVGLFTTVTPTFANVPEGVDLTYAVKMNPIINGVEFSGNHMFSDAALRQFMDIHPGTTLNTTLVGQKVAAINAQYNNAGYIMSHVADVTADDKGILHVVISEGKLEDVIVKGNKKTKTRVILREMKLKKGDLFNKDLARRSVERIYNTGYFEDVNVRLLPGQINRNDVIMEIDVLEQKTGTFTIGAGYSDSDGLVGILGLSETNFRGTGDKVSINWEFGGNTNSNKNYVFSYTRPWVNDHGDSLGFSIFDRESDYDDYDAKGNSIAEYYKRTRGYNMTFGRVRSEYVKDYFTLETKQTRYTDYQGGYDYSKDSSYSNNKGLDFAGMNYLGKNFGRTNSLTWSHVFDNRDSIYDPTRGKRLSFTGILAGHGLGGDFNYYKLIAESRSYYKVGRAHVIAMRFMGGIGFGDMPYSDLFTLGGSDNLRGYEDDQFKGSRMYEGTVEYRFPIIKKVQGVVFSDFGNAWSGTGNIPWYEENNKFHISAGLGVRLTTPIGPVRLDYAEGSDGGKFHFSFGGKF